MVYPRVTARDVAWIAGLVEGEGSFQDQKGSPRITIQMCDRDVLERAALIFGSRVGGYVRQPRGKVSYKPVHTLNVHGTRAVSWMMTLYALMGERRRARIREILAAWRASPRAPRAPLDRAPFMARCHPDRRVAGRGLCDKCYMREWRRKRKCH